MIDVQEEAWKLYCKQTAGSMDVRDFWHELSPRIQKLFIDKAKEKYGTTNS